MYIIVFEATPIDLLHRSNKTNEQRRVGSMHMSSLTQRPTSAQTGLVSNWSESEALSRKKSTRTIDEHAGMRRIRIQTGVKLGMRDRARPRGRARANGRGRRRGSRIGKGNVKQGEGQRMQRMQEGFDEILKVV